MEEPGNRPPWYVFVVGTLGVLLILVALIGVGPRSSSAPSVTSEPVPQPYGPPDTPTSSTTLSPPPATATSSASPTSTVRRVAGTTTTTPLLTTTVTTTTQTTVTTTFFPWPGYPPYCYTCYGYGGGGIRHR